MIYEKKCLERCQQKIDQRNAHFRIETYACKTIYKHNLDSLVVLK